MKTPPKRSLKIYSKMKRLSKLNKGDAFQLIEPISKWRQSVNLHQTENKTKFTFRTMPQGIFLCREK